VALVHDQQRMERLLRDAMRVPIDRTLPHVALAGSEKGLADFYYWAFRLFGLNLPALVWFYYVLLAISVALFFVAFRQSPFCLLLLMLYLIGHAYLVDYANSPLIQTVHNSRFFSALAFLPAMHVLLLLVRAAPPSLSSVTIAAMQVLLFGFLLFCRIEAFWQGLAIAAAGLLTVGSRATWKALVDRARARAAVAKIATATWPALLMTAGMVGVLVYSSVALDRRYYASETKTHAFWHPLFAGMVGASPELWPMFAEGPRDYTDNVVYLAVLADLRKRNEVPPEIAFRHEGVIYINAMWNMGVFDRLARRIFFDVVRQHPWLALKSFLYDKPRDQIVMLGHAKVVSVARVLLIIPLTIAAAFVSVAAGLCAPRRDEIGRAAPAVVIVLACSWIPTLVVPSALIVDTVLLYLVLALLYCVCLHVAAWRYVRRIT
jgi:hypothetical protein